MLTRAVLQSILGPYVDLNSIPDDDFHSLDWKIQDAKKGSILFYKITNQRSKDVLRENLGSANYSLMILSEEISPIPNGAITISIDQWPALQKTLSDILYPIPEQAKYVGVTGTNGKTTTVHLIGELAKLYGLQCLTIGTLGVKENQKQVEEFSQTSPSYIDFRKYIYRFGKKKDVIAFEMSSHALEQERFYKVSLDAAGWLSFSQDHLDYHQTMGHYFEAKCKMFNHLKMHAQCFVPETQAQLREKLTSHGKKIQLSKTVFKQSLPPGFQAIFNKENLSVALSIMNELFGARDISLESLTLPEGRSYTKIVGEKIAVVDFAHTPDALENICSALKKSYPDYKLKVLFGCGGDRDRTKRPKMGEAVSRYADYAYVTSDNPRSENPSRIIEDILPGLLCSFEQEIDRTTAVTKALETLRPKEILLLAGKGHEDYIEINNVKTPYSDIALVDSWCKRSGKL